MALMAQWEAYAKEQQLKDSKFVQTYYQAEKEIYRQILTAKPEQNTVAEYARAFGVDLMIMTGFLEGVNDSLTAPNDLDSMTQDTVVNLDYDPELLYKNMVKAKASWLYELPEWEPLLSEDRRKELYKEQKLSTTVVKGEKIGRNDPCPCGSGKKYKKCHGRDL